MQPFHKLVAVVTALRQRRADRDRRDIDIEISHDVEWERYRRDRAPLCIAMKHMRS